MISRLDLAPSKRWRSFGHMQKVEFLTRLQNLIYSHCQKGLAYMNCLAKTYPVQMICWQALQKVLLLCRPAALVKRLKHVDASLKLRSTENRTQAAYRHSGCKR